MMGASSFFGRTTVAEPRRTPTTGGRPRRSAAASAAWKSGLLASGFGAVLLGWALLARAETPAVTAALAQPAQPQPNVMVAQVPAAVQVPTAVPQRRRLNQQSSGTRATVPSLPQAPVFRRPITRSRGS
jgi:hypothetical protein